MKIEIVEKEIGNVLEIEENISMLKMPSVMREDYQTLFDYICKEGQQCTNPPYARYIGVNWKEEMEKPKWRVFIDVFFRKWHFMTGIPVSPELKGAGRMVANTIPNRKYVQTLHKGPYQKVGATYVELCKWIQENNVNVIGESIEIYLNDPREVAKEELETLVLVPLAE